MKRLSLIPTIVLAIASLFVLPSCSYEGRVLDSHQYQLGGHTFVQKRILICDKPLETRVISYQVQ